MTKKCEPISPRDMNLLADSLRIYCENLQKPLHEFNQFELNTMARAMRDCRAAIEGTMNMAINRIEIEKLRNLIERR